MDINALARKKTDTADLKILKIRQRCPYCLGTQGIVSIDELGNHIQVPCSNCDSSGYIDSILYCDDYEEYSAESLARDFKKAQRIY